MIVVARQWTGGGGVLGLSLIQRAGDWSYSMYLWHWPIWVFALSWLSLRGYPVGVTQKISMVLATLALSVVSYYCVEQPFRARRDLWTPPRLLAGSGLALASLLVFLPLAFLSTACEENAIPANGVRRIVLGWVCVLHPREGRQCVFNAARRG